MAARWLSIRTGGNWSTSRCGTRFRRPVPECAMTYLLFPGPLPRCRRHRIDWGSLSRGETVAVVRAAPLRVRSAECDTPDAR
jgi:hypothetical protein